MQDVLLILSTSQCWPTSSHIMLISYKHLQRIPISYLHRPHCQHRNVDPHQVDIVSTLCAFFFVYIHDPRYRNADRHRVYIVPFFNVYDVTLKKYM